MLWTYTYPTWLVGGVHRTVWIFSGVWSIVQLAEHLLLEFSFLEGAWSDTFNIWLISFCPRPLRKTWGWGALIDHYFHWGYPVLSIGIPLVLPGFFIMLFSRAAWPDQAAWRTWKYWFPSLKASFWYSERLSRSKFLLNSEHFSI